jgi:hypothetical protein
VKECLSRSSGISAETASSTGRSRTPSWFRELGHLLMTDLVWRKGFADWMAAGAVFDLAKKVSS